MKVLKTRKKEEKRKSWMKQLKLILKKARYNRGTHQDSSYNSYQGAGSWKESEGWKSLSLQKPSNAQFVKQR